MPNKGRPPSESSAGWVTIRDAAERCGVSYSTAYRAVVTNKIVRSRQAPNGVRLIDVRDLSLIVAHAPTPTDQRPRVSVWLTPDTGRYASWAAAAEARGLSVHDWIKRLADRAAKTKIAK